MNVADPEKENAPGGETGGVASEARNRQETGLAESITANADAAKGNPLVADRGAIRDALMYFQGSGPYRLHSVGEGRPFASSGPLSDVNAAADWAVARNAERANVYFVPARVSPRLGMTKAKDVDVVSVGWIWADVDRDKKGPPLPEQRPVLLAKLEGDRPACLPEPTAIIDSGGGYWGFWRLATPLPPDEARKVLCGVADVLESDRTFDPSRIARLPGTVNWPDEGKRKAGQVPALARLIRGGDGVVDPAALPVGDPGKKAEARDAPALDPSALPRVDSPSDIPGIEPRVAALIANGFVPGDPGEDEPDKYPSRSEAFFDVLCQLVRAGLDDTQIAGIVTDPAFGISGAVYDPKGEVLRPEERLLTRRKLGNVLRQIGNARDKVAAEDAARPPAVWQARHELTGGPMDWAKAFRNCVMPNLKHWRDGFLNWNGSAYAPMTDGEVRAAVWTFLDASTKPGKDEKPIRFRPVSENVSGVVDALRALCLIDRHLTEPRWLDGRAGPDPLSLVACRNGLLNLATGELMAPTPAFFAQGGLDFDYDPDGPKPERFLTFLDELWPTDPESRTALQAFMGYLLTPDTSQQKALLMIGPPRAGKSVIGRLMEDLVGRDYVIAPSLNSFGGSFPLEDFLGKRLALIQDVRLGRRSDETAIAETLLKVSGEDRVTVGRKNLTGVSDTLLTRFVMMTNEIPRFRDTSGALANRFVVLTFTQDFLGKEDSGLTEKLRQELPGILRWAMEGWRKVREDGRLPETEAGRQMVRNLKEMASPVAAFVAEECDVVGGDAMIEKGTMIAAFRSWYQRELGREYQGTLNSFSRDLYAATGNRVSSSRPRGEGGGRDNVFAGIRWKPAEPPF